jgi:spoIIIJ-associated protein
VNESNNAPKEFVGNTPEEALSAALAHFGKGEEELTIRTLSVNEVAGLGGLTMVVAAPKGYVKPAPSAGGDRDEGRGRGGRDRGEGRDRGDRGDRGGRDDKRGRGDRDRGGRSESRGRGPRKERDSAEPQERKPREAKASSGEPGVRTTTSDLGKFVEGLVDLMEIGDFSLEEAEDGDLNIVNLRGPAADNLGSGDGRVVDAIQFLLNQASLRGGEESRRVVLDVEGDPDERETYLVKLADRAARRAEDTERAMALDPMNPKDRRIVHVALREMDGIATMSVGSGRYRRVVVVPKGAPEYEEASKSNQTSTSGA